MHIRPRAADLAPREKPLASSTLMGSATFAQNLRFYTEVRVVQPRRVAVLYRLVTDLSYHLLPGTKTDDI